MNRHWTKGGTGITNFNPEMYHLFVRAIEKHGDSDLYICKEPISGSGAKECYHLGCRNPKDLSAFWRVFAALKAEAEM